MTLKLYDFQHEMVAKVREAFRRNKRVLLVSPTGSGKTVTGTYMVGRAVDKGPGILWVVHRDYLLDQTSATFSLEGIPHSFMAAGRTLDPSSPAWIGSVASIKNRAHLIAPPRLIFMDECFPAGTLVDGYPIETLRVGQNVRSFDRHGKIVVRRVMRQMKRKTSTIVRVTLVCGRSMVSTENHPVLTDEGWRDAASLTEGCTVYADPLHGVRQAVCVPVTGVLGSLSGNRAEFLQQDMPIGMDQSSKFGADGANKPSVCIGAHDREKPDAQSRDAGEGVGNTAGDRAYAASAWRERKAAAPSAIASFVSVGGGLEDRVICPDEEETRDGVSNPLQDRHRQFGADDSHRDRRLQSYGIDAKDAGYKEGRTLIRSRVERVEIFQRGRDWEFDALCPDGVVYNLEIEDTHTYFANGIAVHNCHHAAAGTWAAILDRWPDAHVVGLTATPQRLDGKGLDQFFQEMVLGPAVSWLIDNGRLSKYRAFSLGQPNLSGVRTIAGDYDQAAIEAIMNQRQLRGDTVAHYRKYALGKRAVYFAVTVAHSKNLAATFCEHGIAAEHLDASTPSAERIAAVKRLASGETMIICNVEILSEGFDVSSQAGRDVPLEVVGLCRPTHSLVLHLQQVGRALRPKAEPAIILDHAGNLLRHGLPDQERAWTLAGQKKAKKGEVSEPAVKMCPECFAVHAAHLKVCPECGYEYPETTKVLEVTDGELVELKRESVAQQAIAAERLKRERKEEEWRAKSVVELAALGRRRGYKYPEAWAAKLFSIREARRREWSQRKKYGGW